MSDYIERQKAIEACENTPANSIDAEKGLLILNGLGRACDVIKAIPAADVAPVVRCKDCKHYYFADNRIPQEQRYVCEISGEIWRPDSFCSYGERKE